MRHNFEEMKELLSEELDKLTNKQEITLGRLETIDKLTHSIKSLATIIAMEEGGKSGRRYSRNSYDNGGNMNGNSMNGDYSGARRKRDSMGRYSRTGYSYDNEVIDELYEAMEKAPADMKHKIQKIIDEFEK